MEYFHLAASLFHGCLGVFHEIVLLLGKIAWPLVTIIFIHCFHDPIAKKIAQLSELSPTKAAFNNQQTPNNNPIEEASSLQNNDELPNIPWLPRSNLMGVIEKALTDNLRSYDGTTHHDVNKTGILIRLLAQARLEALFEKIYGVIFGSQLRLLAGMESKTINKDEARRFFEFYKEQYNITYIDNYDFNNWIKFLTSYNLIKDVGDSWEIAEPGKDFLLFLRAQNRSFDKAL